MRNAGAAPGDDIRQAYTFKDKNYQNFLLLYYVFRILSPAAAPRGQPQRRAFGTGTKRLMERKAQNEKQTALYKSSLLLACCKFEDGLEINFIFKEFSRFALDLAGNCSVAANLHGF